MHEYYSYSSSQIYIIPFHSSSVVQTHDIVPTFRSKFCVDDGWYIDRLVPTTTLLLLLIFWVDEYLVAKCRQLRSSSSSCCWLSSHCEADDSNADEMESEDECLVDILQILDEFLGSDVSTMEEVTTAVEDVSQNESSGGDEAATTMAMAGRSAANSIRPGTKCDDYVGQPTHL